MPTQAELDEHLALVRQRLENDRPLSTLELRAILKDKREELRLPGIDEVVTNAEIALVQALIDERQPQMEPEDYVQSLAESNPEAAGMLQWQLERNALQAQVDAAQEVVNEHLRNGTSSDAATHALARAEQALQDHPRPAWVQRLEQARQLAEEAVRLEKEADNATTQQEQVALQHQANLLREESRLLDAGKEPPPPADADPPVDDPVARAEALVAAAQSAQS